MNAHSSLYSLSVYTHLPFILLGPASNKVKRYNLPHFKSAFDIPSWTFYAWIIDCVILLFKNEWMSPTVPFSSSLSASRPNTKKETSGVIKGKLSKQHKLAFFIYLFFKAILWYIRSTVHLFPPLWKGRGSNGRWLQAISPLLCTYVFHLYCSHRFLHCSSYDQIFGFFLLQHSMSMLLFRKTITVGHIPRRRQVPFHCAWPQRGLGLGVVKKLCYQYQYQ